MEDRSLPILQREIKPHEAQMVYSEQQEWTGKELRFQVHTHNTSLHCFRLSPHAEADKMNATYACTAY